MNHIELDNKACRTILSKSSLNKLVTLFNKRKARREMEPVTLEQMIFKGTAMVQLEGKFPHHLHIMNREQLAEVTEQVSEMRENPNPEQSVHTLLLTHESIGDIGPSFCYVGMTNFELANFRATFEKELTEYATNTLTEYEAGMVKAEAELERRELYERSRKRQDSIRNLKDVRRLSSKGQQMLYGAALRIGDSQATEAEKEEIFKLLSDLVADSKTWEEALREARTEIFEEQGLPSHPQRIRVRHPIFSY